MRVPVIRHPFLYRALKISYATDIGGTFLNGRMTAEMDTESLGQSVGVHSPRFLPSLCLGCDPGNTLLARLMFVCCLATL